MEFDTHDHYTNAPITSPATDLLQVALLQTEIMTLREETRALRQELAMSQKMIRQLAVKWTLYGNGNIPMETAVYGGDEGWRRAYVIRAHLNGALIPGKIISGCGQQHGYIGTGGVEHIVKSYEVLEDPYGALRWVSSRDSDAMKNALVAGKSESGDILLVARARIEGVLVLGKAQRGHGNCHIPYASKEHQCSDFEVLAFL